MGPAEGGLALDLGTRPYTRMPYFPVLLDSLCYTSSGSSPVFGVYLTAGPASSAVAWLEL